MVKVVVVLNSNEGVCGAIYFTEEGDGSTVVTESLSSLKPGLHGFQVHALRDMTNGCMSTGPHFNPAGKEHGAPKDENHHVGDLGNVFVREDGAVNFKIEQIPLTGSNSIVGRAVVVHTDPDDLRKGIGCKTSIYEAPFSGVSILCYCYSKHCGLLMDKNEHFVHFLVDFTCCALIPSFCAQ